MAALHPQLEKDCIYIGRLKLCHLLLMNDANYPWFILVPDREQTSEIHQLCREERWQLMEESNLLTRCLQELFAPDKLNIAALGNVVPQLHVHHIVRFIDDPAWPRPAWGQVAVRPYHADESGRIIQRVISCLGEHLCAEPSA